MKINITPAATFLSSSIWAGKLDHIFFKFLGVGWDLVHLVRRPIFGLLYQPRMIDDDECGVVGGMRIGRGNRSIRRKPAPVPLCPPQIPHDLGSNPGRRGGKPATNRPSYGTALIGPLTNQVSRDSVSPGPSNNNNNNNFLIVCIVNRHTASTTGHTQHSGSTYTANWSRAKIYEDLTCAMPHRYIM
jgi:hypothetical protein